MRYFKERHVAKYNLFMINFIILMLQSWGTLVVDISWSPMYSILSWHNSYSRDNYSSWHNESKLIINESSLDQLLSVCRMCCGMCALSKIRQGAYLQVVASCMDCSHTFTFQTTPKIGKWVTFYTIQIISHHMIIFKIELVFFKSII